MSIKNKIHIEYICDCGMNFKNKKDNYERHKNKKKPCIKNNLKQNNKIDDEINDEINDEIIIDKNKKKSCIKNNLKQNNKIGDEIIINKNITNIINENIINENIINENIINENIINQCKYCDKIFVRKYGLTRHFDGRCKEKNIHNSNKNIEQINYILIQLEELKKENKELKKDNKQIKIQLKQKKTKSNINIEQINIVNNIINFNNVNYANVDKKLFVQPIMNARLYGKAIILQMIENIYINENLPEYQNLIITDKNRGYVKIYNNGKWKTDNIQIINLVIDGIISHSKTILDELKQIYINNVQAKSRLNTSKKYIDLCDLEHLDELEDEQANGDVNNIAQIKRCKDFREMVYKDTINLFHDNKNILIKPKLHQEIIELD